MQLKVLRNVADQHLKWYAGSKKLKTVAQVASYEKST